MISFREKIIEAREFILSRTSLRPEAALILGSGLGGLVKDIAVSISIPYREIPHFPISTVEGHAGCLVLGELEGKKVVVMQGRFHYYEGYSLTEVTFPVRVMQALGAETLIVTNAAGGVNPSYAPGDLMLITDHINLLGANPLLGPNDGALGERFPDMTEAYNKKLRETAKLVAKEEKIKIQEGVYCAMSGPSYETPAEIRFLGKIGGDAVGMSTVPEVIVANHAGMKVLGISCITNMGAGISPEKLNHQEVMAAGNEAVARFTNLVEGVIRRM